MPYPTKRNNEVVEEILVRISGGETLAEICRSHDKFPHPSAFRDWVRKDETLAVAYARARRDGFDAIADDIFRIVDEEPAHTEKGMDKAAVAWQKNRIDARLKLLACWDPKHYGAKVDMTSSDGSMASKPSVVQFVAPDVKVGGE